MLHERISSQETAFKKAGEQLRQVQSQLGIRVISLWDAEYGCAPFLLTTAYIPSDKEVRLRPNLSLATPKELSTRSVTPVEIGDLVHGRAYVVVQVTHGHIRVSGWQAIETLVPVVPRLKAQLEKDVQDGLALKDP